jgi:hypothetical protein
MRENFAGCALTQRDKIDRLPPGGRFLSATCHHHLADDSVRHGRRVLPTDQVKAFECLVDEVRREGARPSFATRA